MVDSVSMLCNDLAKKEEVYAEPASFGWGMGDADDCNTRILLIQVYVFASSSIASVGSVFVLQPTGRRTVTRFEV